MATLHLDGSANGSILLDLHAGGLARPSLFIIHIALFPDSMLILAPWPLPSGQHAHTRADTNSSACLTKCSVGHFISAQFGGQTRSVLFLATRALLSFPQKMNIIGNKSGNCYMTMMTMSHLFILVLNLKSIWSPWGNGSYDRRFR